MFGIPTFPKLLILAAVIALVWYFIRRGQVAKAEGGDTGRVAKPGAGREKPVEELIQCKSCGAYFPAKSGCSCGQSGR